MQFFGTSFNVVLGNLQLHMSIGIDEREMPVAGVRLEDMPRLEIGAH